MVTDRAAAPASERHLPRGLIADLLVAADLLSNRWKARNAAVGRRLAGYAAELTDSARLPLTADRIRVIANDVGMFNVEYEDYPGDHCDRFARAIEAALGIVPLAPQDTGGK